MTDNFFSDALSSQDAINGRKSNFKSIDFLKNISRYVSDHIHISAGAVEVLRNGRTSRLSIRTSWIDDMIDIVSSIVVPHKKIMDTAQVLN